MLLWWQMHTELVEYLRRHALTLVEIARKMGDAETAGRLEAIAIDLLKRARSLESTSFF